VDEEEPGLVKHVGWADWWLELEPRFKLYPLLMKPGLTIGELAEAAQVPTSTVRFYEREGLLRPSGRSASNYRLYAEADLERLRFIRAAQATGFTLGDAKALLRPGPCSQVQSLIESRLREVSRRMAELLRVKRVLERSLRTCQEHAPSGRCKVVDDLSSSARRKARR
jgi:MerR family mercuric resistance operon transcriptional regulator